MKRLLVFLLAILAISTGLRAQTKEAKPWLHSGLTISAGPGMFNRGEWMIESYALTADLGYRLNVIKGFSWQVLRLSGAYGFNEGRKMIGAYTGVRYDTPRIPFLYNCSLYANADFGVVHEKTSIYLATYETTTPVSWDLGVGIKFSRNCSVGLSVRPNYGKINGDLGIYKYKETSFVGTIQFEYIF